MAAGLDDLNESSPLLQGSATATTTAEQRAVEARKQKTLWLALLANLLASSAGGFLSIPTARLIEDVLCHQYYGEAQNFEVPIDESLCKDQSIQSRLSFVIATQSALIAGVGLLAAFPWSLAADRIGRKPVLIWSLTGITMGGAISTMVLWFRNIFPVELIWLEAVPQLIGGGNPVAIGLLLSVIADATNEEERAVVFMRQHVASVCGNLIAPTLSSFIMSRVGPWPPAFTGLALCSLSVAAVALVPETLPAESVSSTIEAGGDERGGGGGDDPSSRQTGKLSHLMDRLRESLSILRSPSLIILLVACLVTSPVTHATGSFMAVFLSKRYGIQLFKAGYVQSAFGLAQVIQTLLVLPWLSRILLLRPTPPSSSSTATTPRRRPRPLRFPDEHHRDLAIARWSAWATGAAALFLGLAPALPAFVLGLAVLAAGAGCTSLLRSLMSLYVDPAHRSRLFGLAGMVEIVGSIYAQPMLAGLFSLGMRLGGGWIGLPYFGLTVLVAAMVTLLFFVRVPKEALEQPESAAEEDEF